MIQPDCFPVVLENMTRGNNLWRNVVKYDLIVDRPRRIDLNVLVS